MVFNLDQDITKPLLLHDSKHMTLSQEQRNLIKFLEQLKKYGMLEERNMTGRIVNVEDQFATSEQMKLHFADHKLKDRLTTITNGQEAIDFFENLVMDSQTNPTGSGACQPVCLLLLDINIPRVDGLSVLR